MSHLRMAQTVPISASVFVFPRMSLWNRIWVRKAGTWWYNVSLLHFVELGYQFPDTLSSGMPFQVAVQDVPKLATMNHQQAPPKSPVAAEKAAVRSFASSCSSLLPVVITNLKTLSSLATFCTCWAPALLRES